jgi:cytochrome c556
MQMRGVAALLVAALVALPVDAHEGATGFAKERMDAMSGMGRAMKEINRRIESNRNLAGIDESAANVHETALKIPQLFPPGSGTGITDAKPIIWEQWDQFQAKAQELASAASALGSIASSGDPKAIYARYSAVTHVCSGCHDMYRQKHK